MRGVVLLSFLGLISCSFEVKELRELPYKIVGQLEEYPDSTFFSDIRHAESGKHLEVLDLSDISFIRKNLDYISTKVLGPQSYFVYIKDGCLYDECLYLLCASLGDDYHCNILLKIDVSDKVMKPVGYCVLPGKYYSSVCVSSDYLYAVCENPCVIEKIELEDK